jgi:hypothetical protein
MTEKFIPLLPLRPPLLFGVVSIALVPGAGAVVEMLAATLADMRLPIAMVAGYVASLLALLAAIATPWLPAEWFYEVKGAKRRAALCLVVMSVLLAVWSSGPVFMQ